jgi:hypothetical protein
VAPILRGECSQCHGATAPQTGLNYRLDFYNTDMCGAAAHAIPPSNALPPGPILAGAAASLIYEDIEPTSSGFPKMPPQPGAALAGWEREMLENWTNYPSMGLPPASNRPPTIQASGIPATVDKSLQFIALLDDPDGDDVIGVIKADVTTTEFAMNRTGSFAVDMDTSTWPNGEANLTAVVCDGWTSVSVPIPTVVVKH